MGTLDAHLTPSDQQGGTGAGNAPPSPTAGAQMRAMKVGEALQRLQCARVIAEIGEMVGAPALKADAFTIAREAVQSLLP